MVPTALFFVLCGIGISVLVPQRISRQLSSHQVLVPAVVNTFLFSLYFSLLGFGYVRGHVSLFGLGLTYYVLLPAMIVGIGALLHIVVRPYQRSNLPED